MTIFFKSHVFKYLQTSGLNIRTRSQSLNLVPKILVNVNSCIRILIQHGFQIELWILRPLCWRDFWVLVEVPKIVPVATGIVLMKLMEDLKMLRMKNELPTQKFSTCAFFRNFLGQNNLMSRLVSVLRSMFGFSSDMFTLLCNKGCYIMMKSPLLAPLAQLSSYTNSFASNLVCNKKREAVPWPLLLLWRSLCND